MFGATTGPHQSSCFMSVRKTESHVPASAAAADLGEAVVAAEDLRNPAPSDVLHENLFLAIGCAAMLRL
jgi:hypothetical protein